MEHVQFEDDDYYYYVKAVPKIDVSMLQKNVTTFSDEEETEEDLAATKEEDFDFTEEHPAGENEANAEDFNNAFAEEEEY